MNPHDLTLASRRVGAAICAFGGSIKPEHVPRTASIFRPKGISSDESTSTGKVISYKAYKERLKSRYQVSGTHISWDVEEDPPVDSSDANQTRNNILAQMNTNESYAPKDSKADSESNSRNSLNKAGSRLTQSSYSSVVEMTSNGTKMKYRCKLCGQPKQNHNCPYRHFMQRSLGITVHPAVNSFTAHEPGALAAPLSDVNNFVSYDSDYGSSECTRMTSAAPGTGKHHHSHATIAPENSRPEVFQSPRPSLSPRTSSSGTTTPARDSSDKQGARKRSHSELETMEVDHDTSRPFIEEVTVSTIL